MLSDLYINTKFQIKKKKKKTKPNQSGPNFRQQKQKQSGPQFNVVYTINVEEIKPLYPYGNFKNFTENKQPKININCNIN